MNDIEILKLTHPEARGVPQTWAVLRTNELLIQPSVLFVQDPVVKMAFHSEAAQLGRLARFTPLGLPVLMSMA